MGGEPTVLGMINTNLEGISKDVKDIKTDLKNGAVKMENHEGRIKANASGLKATQKMSIKHIENKEKHYNPYHSESFGQKIIRKKGEISVASVGGGLIGLIIFLIDKFM